MGATAQQVSNQQNNVAANLQIAQASQASALQAAGQLVELQERISGKCALCFFFTNTLNARHMLLQCPSMYSRCLQCFKKGCRHQQCNIKKKYVTGACVRCFLPSQVSGMMLHQGGKIGNECNSGLSDVLYPVAMYAYMCTNLQSKIISRFDNRGVHQLRDPLCYASWLQKQVNGLPNMALVCLFVNDSI